MRESLCWHCNKSSTSDLCSWVAEFRPPPGAVMKGNLIIDCPQFVGERPQTDKSKQKKAYKKICQNCGKTFMAAYSNQKYCSISCRNIAMNYSMSIEKICLICGSKFKGIPRQKYCCKDCAAVAQRESYKKWRERKKGR